MFLNSILLFSLKTLSQKENFQKIIKKKRFHFFILLPSGLIGDFQLKREITIKYHLPTRKPYFPKYFTKYQQSWYVENK